MFASLALAAELVPMPPMRQPVMDAVLNSAAPSVNSGRDFVLQTGPGRVLLIRHNALTLTALAGKRITAGRLVLTIADGAPKVKDVKRLTARWTEGSGWLGGTGTGDGATWNHAHSSLEPLKWEAPGASGPTDAVLVPGWTAKQEGDKLIIEGLGEAMQSMSLGALDNNGFRIEFEGDGRLRSSEDPVAGPEFQLETENAGSEGGDLQVVEISPEGPPSPQPTQWQAIVANKGRQMSSPANFVWRQGREVVGSAPIPAIPPGGALRVTRQLPWKSKDDSELAAAISGEVSGQSTRMRSLSVAPWAMAVAGPKGSEDAVRAAVEQFNLIVAPMSRFGFCQAGVAERLRFVSDPARADVVLGEEAGAGLSQAIQSLLMQAVPWKGAPQRGGYGLTMDTRDDRLELEGVPLPALGWTNRQAGIPNMVESGLLGKYEAGMLHAMAKLRGDARKAFRPRLPSVLLLRCFDGSARPLNDMPLSIFRNKAEGKELVRTRTISSGALVLSPSTYEPPEKSLFPADAGPGDSLVFVFGRMNGPTEAVSLPWIQMVEEGMRGTMAAGSVEMRVQLPLGVVDVENDAALGRPVEDSLGRFPAELAGLVDGREDTGVSFPAVARGSSQFIEIDLGRDKMVGEVEITFGAAPWSAFQVRYYGTAQPPGSAQIWLDVQNTGYVLGGMSNKVRLRGASTLMRYIRFSPIDSAATTITGIKVRTLTQTGAPGIP